MLPRWCNYKVIVFYFLFDHSIIEIMTSSEEFYNQNKSNRLLEKEKEWIMIGIEAK